jgi:hypothetical protein
MCTQWVFTFTQWHSCACSGVQRLFTLTHWDSCAHNGCSGAVHNHSKAFTCTQLAFRGCSILTQRRSSCSHSKGPVDMVLNMWSALRPYKNLLSISLECSSTFLSFGFAKQEELEIMTSHMKRWLVGSLGVSQWDWKQKIIKYCENSEN